MATSFTYTTLKTALESMLEETGDEYATFIDTIIPLAEDKILRDLDLELFDDTATSTLVTGSMWVAKPAGIVSLRTMHYINALGVYVLIEPKSWEFLKDYWPTSATTTTPRFFSEYSETTWAVAGTPSIDIPVVIRYMKRPAGLTNANPTTWISTTVGDLLFYACLVVSEQFLKADNRSAMWKSDYMERLQAALRELKPNSRHDYMPMTQIPTKEQ
jgi:hypothetical protein